MDDLKTNLRAVLDGQSFGLTLAQLTREYKKKIGEPLQLNDGESVEALLKSMNSVVRTERAVWGETLYFLQTGDPGVVPEIVDDADFGTTEKLPMANEEKGRYSAEEEIGKLMADYRGWITICWNVMRSDTEEDIRSRFSAFGEVVSIRIDKGKAFVRYTCREAAEAAIRELGSFCFIEASRNTKHVQGDTKKPDEASASKDDGGKGESKVPESRNGQSPEADNHLLQIYVSDLPLEFDEMDLEDMFLNFDVRNIRVNASKNRRSAFIEFGSREEVERALKNLCDDNGRHYCVAHKTLVRLQPRDPELKIKFSSTTTSKASEHQDVGSVTANLATMQIHPPVVTPTSQMGKQESNITSPPQNGRAASKDKEKSTTGEVRVDSHLCKHAQMTCRKYPNCLPNCDFRHPLCPLGVQCLNRFCSYDHLHRPKKCHLCIKQSEGLADVRSIITQCDHRRSTCTDFPKCPYGVKCSFKHPPCPDSQCKAWDTCIFEHDGQDKLCYICWKALKADETIGDRPGGRIIKENGATFTLKENVPCRYDMKCWTPQCPYKHPPEWFKKACPWGQRCRRENCSFVHPPITS